MKTKETVIALGLILVITFIAFSPSINNGFTNWDDDQHVTENILIRKLSWANIGKMFTSYYVGAYIPMTILTYSLEYQFFKFNTKTYHLTNLAFHLLNCLLVFWFFRFLTKNVWASLAATLLYAVHPLRVESVAWISERKDVLYAFFYLLSLISFLYFRKKRKITYIIVSFVAFLFSLLSKPMAVTLPIVLLLLDYLENRRFDKAIVIQKAPFFIVAAIFLLIGILSQRSDVAVGDRDSFTIINTIIIACHGMLFYIAKTIIPTKLSCAYLYPESLGNSLFAIIMVLIVLALAALVIISLRRTKKIAFGSIFFLVGILPVLQIVPVGQAIAERYTYISSIGLFYLLAEGIGWVYQKAYMSRQIMRICLSTLLGAIIIVLSILTFYRCQIWKDSITLWSDCLKKYPGIPIAYLNRGVAYISIGELEKALFDFDHALAIEPMYKLAYNNRGSLYFKKGEYEKAIADFNQALAIDQSYGKAYNNRGLIYYTKGNYEKAIDDFNRALANDPNSAIAYNNRGLVYIAIGEYDKAIEDYDRLIGYVPDLPVVYNNRGLAYLGKKEYGRAIVDYNRALRLNPNLAIAYDNRGLAYYRMGDTTKAIRDARIVAALGFKPSSELIKLLNSRLSKK
ncbi:tetratricopeptide repeat protein [Candidatus Bathyarchaeota archaeon]|nr:tetratricopeptide repeat protein [Candidatus Bathyarchaeota archaeon]